jgi:hypothetical protein
MDHWLHEQTLARASTAAIRESNFRFDLNGWLIATL